MDSAEARSRTNVTLRRDPGFREALRQCEEACHALAAASLAISIDDDLALHGHRFRECWHVTMATATALAHFERHYLPTVYELLRACERVARWTSELAALKPTSTCCRCGDLADECASRCFALSTWLASAP
jgi:hypothetical protein